MFQRRAVVSKHEPARDSYTLCLPPVVSYNRAGLFCVFSSWCGVPGCERAETDLTGRAGVHELLDV